MQQLGRRAKNKQNGLTVNSKAAAMETRTINKYMLVCRLKAPPQLMLGRSRSVHTGRTSKIKEGPRMKFGGEVDRRL